MRLLFLTLLLLGGTLSYSQGLTLHSPYKAKVIPFQKYLIIHAHPDGQGELTTKQHSYVYGTLTSVSKDSIHLLVDVFKSETRVDGSFNEMLERKYNSPQRISVLKSNVSGFSVYKSAKANKRRRTFTGIGGTLVGMGLVTIANVAVAGSESRSNLLYAGSIQVGLGTILMLAVKSKKFEFKVQEGLPEWRIE
ncbi:MAG: hypothetical protein AB8F78_03850 [Saprospiraceae bacterium]